MQMYTCTGVRTIRFFESVLATARFIHPTSVASSTSGSSSSTPFEGLHYVHLPASNLYGYIEDTHEISRVNRTTNVLSIDLSVRSLLFSILTYVLFLFTAYINSDSGGSRIDPRGGLLS
jgi:hypothetical protein